MLLKYVKDFSLFLLLFVSFNSDFSLEVGGGSIIKLALAAFVALHAGDYYRFFLEEKSKPMKSFLFFLLVLSVVTMMTSLIHLDDTLSVGFIRIFAIFALFFYLSFMRELDKMLYMLWIIMVFSSVVAYFSDPVDMYSFRKTGATGDPNDFAAQLLVVIFASIYLFQKNNNWLFLLISLAIFSYTLLFAGSKSAFIFLAAMLLMTAIVKFKSMVTLLLSAKGMLATLVLIVALGIGVMNSSTAVKGLQGRAQKTGTLQQRFIVWRAGGEMIRDNFFLGVGFNRFPQVSAGYVKDYLAEEARPSHNIFVKVFAESGVFTFLAFLVFIIMLLKTKFVAIMQSEYYWLYLSSLSVILMGLTIPSLLHKDFWIGLAILSNVVLLFSRQENENMRQMVTES